MNTNSCNQSRVEPASRRTIAGLISPVVRTLLGAIFFLTGLAKIPVAGDFTRSIAELFRLPIPLPEWIAGGAIAAEIVVGACLIIGYRTRLLARTAAVLVSGFLLALAAAVVGGKSTPCRCFGILPLDLPAHWGFLFDVVLLNMALMLATQPGSLERMVADPGKHWRFVLTVCAALFAEAIITAGLFEIARSQPQTDIKSVVRYIAAEHEVFSQPEDRLILLADIGDLTCPPCFDDFVALAESLSTRMERPRTGRVAIVLTDSRSGHELAPAVLKRWAAETGLHFPNVVMEWTLLDSFGFRKSQALAIDWSDHVRFQRNFPLGEPARASLLAMLEAGD